jgi:hypothetical protein
MMLRHRNTFCSVLLSSSAFGPSKTRGGGRLRKPSHGVKSETRSQVQTAFIDLAYQPNVPRNDALSIDPFPDKRLMMVVEEKE